MCFCTQSFAQISHGGGIGQGVPRATNPNDPNCLRGRYVDDTSKPIYQQKCELFPVQSCNQRRCSVNYVRKCTQVLVGYEKKWVCDERKEDQPTEPTTPDIDDPITPTVNPTNGCCFKYTIDYGLQGIGRGCVCLSPNATSTSGNFGTVTQSGGKCYAKPAHNVDIEFVGSCSATTTASSGSIQ